MDAQIVNWLARIAASNARVLMMSSANIHRAASGSSTSYSDDHFESEANEMDAIAKEALIRSGTGQ